MISTYILRKIMRPLRNPLFAKGIIIISIIAVFGVTLEYEGLNELGTIRRGIWNFDTGLKENWKPWIMLKIFFHLCL